MKISRLKSFPLLPNQKKRDWPKASPSIVHRIKSDCSEKRSIFARLITIVSRDQRLVGRLINIVAEELRGTISEGYTKQPTSVLARRAVAAAVRIVPNTKIRISVEVTIHFVAIQEISRKGIFNELNRFARSITELGKSELIGETQSAIVGGLA